VLAAARGGRQLPRPEDLNVARRTLALSLRGWQIGFHGGKVTARRPRVRSYDGHELALPTWMAAQAEDWLGRRAMNLMLINVSTRKLRRAV